MMHPGIFPQKITEVVKTEDTFLTGKMSHITQQKELHGTINKNTIVNLTQIVTGDHCNFNCRNTINM